MNLNIFQNSPVENQDFIWIAAYADGTFLSEYNYDTKAENSFYFIDRSQLLRFGLIGYGMNMYYEVFGGVYKIAGQMIEIFYRVNDKEYALTGQQMMYNDIITYKNAEATFDLMNRNGAATSTITQYNFGYKQNILIDDVQFGFKTICSVPYGQPVYLNVRLVANQDMNGVLCIKKNGVYVAEIDAPLQENIHSELNWQVVI
ncbi:hypothetical protein GCM10023310_72160 [Paenibacillus vulneris]|uniref:Uncharacterized protein n=1 Tax=Paenibacillus vulneris TaxID=1133364 RepID=A0ABW3UIU9_9BACL